MIQINGGVGSGKTFIAEALKLKFEAEGKKVCCLTTHEDANMSKYDVFIFDHVRGKEMCDEISYANNLVENGKNVVFVSQTFLDKLKTTRLIRCGKSE